MSDNCVSSVWQWTLPSLIQTLQTLRRSSNTFLIQSIQCFLLLFELICRLLHSQVAFCCFKDANKTCWQADTIITEHGEKRLPKNLLAMYYKGLSILYFAKSEYSLSYNWSIKSLEIIGPKTPDK